MRHSNFYIINLLQYSLPTSFTPNRNKMGKYLNLINKYIEQLKHENSYHNIHEITSRIDKIQEKYETEINEEIRELVREKKQKKLEQEHKISNQNLTRNSTNTFSGSYESCITTQHNLFCDSGSVGLAISNNFYVPGHW